jgi:hypothetical protein
MAETFRGGAEPVASRLLLWQFQAYLRVTDVYQRRCPTLAVQSFHEQFQSHWSGRFATLAAIHRVSSTKALNIAADTHLLHAGRLESVLISRTWGDY